MSQPSGQIIASVGSVSVAVVGGSATALSAATVIIAVGAGAALCLAGYGMYRWLSGKECGKPRDERRSGLPTKGDAGSPNFLVRRG